MVMTLSLASCGNKTETPATDSTPSASDQTTEPSADPITISISHSYTELDQVSVELNNAKKNIEERTNGAVIVNLYPNNTFGNLVDGGRGGHGRFSSAADGCLQPVGGPVL